MDSISPEEDHIVIGDDAESYTADKVSSVGHVPMYETFETDALDNGTLFSVLNVDIKFMWNIMGTKNDILWVSFSVCHYTGLQEEHGSSGGSESEFSGIVRVLILATILSLDTRWF